MANRCLFNVIPLLKINLFIIFVITCKTIYQKLELDIYKKKSEHKTRKLNLMCLMHKIR